MQGRRCVGVFIAISAVCLAVGGALAQSPDFFFNYEAESLNSPSEAKRLYKRLQREAADACSPMEESARAACESEVVARVMTGIDSDRLRRVHDGESGGDVSPSGQQFYFVFDDQELDSLGGTRRLYERLQEEAAIACAESGAGADAECDAALVDRVIAGVDESRLNRRHEEVRGRSVYITDW